MILDRPLPQQSRWKLNIDRAELQNETVWRKFISQNNRIKYLHLDIVNSASIRSKFMSDCIVLFVF